MSGRDWRGQAARPDRIPFLSSPRGEEQGLDPPPLRAGLLGDEHVAEHFFGKPNRLVRRRGDFDAALEAGLESSLAAAAGMDLDLTTTRELPLATILSAAGRTSASDLAGISSGTATPYLASNCLA